MQSRKRVAPLISEFASVHFVVLPLVLATKFLTPGYKLPAAVGKNVSCTPGSLEGAGLDPADQEVKKAMQSGDPEAVALLVNRQDKVAAKDVSLLLDLLPSENLRWSGKLQPSTISQIFPSRQFCSRRSAGGSVKRQQVP